MKQIFIRAAIICGLLFVSTPVRAAIVFTNEGASSAPDMNSTSDASSFSTESWTPPTSGLILACVFSRAVTASENTLPTISGNNITWTQIETLAGASDTRVTLFGANASGSSAGATTIDFAGAVQRHRNVSFASVAGADLSGGVLAAIVQKPTNSGTGTTATVSLSAAGNANNRPYMCTRTNQNEVIDPRENWTELDDMSNTTLVSTETQYRADAFETTATSTWATSTGWLAIAVEIKAAAAGRRPAAPIIMP